MTDYNPFSLEGKTILVTGASSGIGKSVAIECNKMGASVVLTARNEQRLQETANEIGDARYIIADLTKPEDIDNLVSQIPEIDGLVLCAGKAWTMPVKMATSEKILDVMQTNFISPVELSRLCFKKKKIKQGASIVIISSVGGIAVYEPGQVMYGASKAALNSYMHFAANEFAVRDIRVNSICPGMIETPMIHRGTITEEQLEEYKSKYPLRRFGKPEEIAYGVIYLLSEASSWVTGTSIIIDGGSTMRN